MNYLAISRFVNKEIVLNDMYLGSFRPEENRFGLETAHLFGGDRCRASESAQTMRQLKPDSDLGLSLFSGKILENVCAVPSSLGRGGGGTMARCVSQYRGTSPMRKRPPPYDPPTTLGMERPADLNKHLRSGDGQLPPQSFHNLPFRQRESHSAFPGERKRDMMIFNLPCMPV